MGTDRQHEPVAVLADDEPVNHAFADRVGELEHAGGTGGTRREDDPPRSRLGPPAERLEADLPGSLMDPVLLKHGRLVLEVLGEQLLVDRHEPGRAHAASPATTANSSTPASIPS